MAEETTKNIQKHGDRKHITNDTWDIEEIRGGIQKFLESKDNKNTTHQNLLDTARMCSCDHLHQKAEKSQINSLMVYLELLEKQEQAKPKIIKTRTSQTQN
jgi:hypothetical protein